MAGYTGYGSQVIGSDEANTVVGTNLTDSMSLGKGVDTLTVSTGNDVVNMGAGDDAINFTETLIEANSGTTATHDGDAGTDTVNVTAATTGLVDADLRGLTNVEVLDFNTGDNTATIGDCLRQLV